MNITANAYTHSNVSKLNITKAIADTVTTGNFMPSGSKVINIKKSTIPIKVKSTAREIIKSTETDQLPPKNLPLESIIVHLFTAFKHASVSIGLFCNNGCLAIFDEK